MKIISVVGARPNFMKVAPIDKAIKNFNKQLDQKGEYLTKITHLICHTGQHYDEKMSKIFFDDLGLPKPHYYLGVGGGSHAEQTGKIMIEFEKVLLKEKPDLVIVVGDVNSTIACSLTAVKIGIKVAHVEAGLRSFDRSMPEEINRILTDSISDYLFVTERSGIENLTNEGISSDKVHFVGHVMIDSLIQYLPAVDSVVKLSIASTKQDQVSNYDIIFGSEQFILVTMHRPSNVDFKEKIVQLLDMLNQLSVKRRVIFPIHPRTKNNILKYGLDRQLNKNLIITDPIGYLDFISLIKNAELIVTDSGGIQEESTYLGVQCVTIRNSTERPITVEVGTNHLVGDNFNNAKEVINNILGGNKKQGNVPELWDGKAAERIVNIIYNKYKIR